MFPEVPVFDSIRDNWDDRVTAWDLGKRPVRSRRHDLAAVLDPETAIVAACDPGIFRQVVRDQGAEEIAEVVHQLDLERAAQPPVIEVTVTTPPGGIPRAELTQIVGQAVRDFTGPQPVLSGSATNPFPVVRPGQPRRRSKVLLATRRAGARLRRRLPDAPPAPPALPAPPVLPVSEDDRPTQVLPAFRDEPAVVEVRLP